jgi:predicted ATPase
MINTFSLSNFKAFGHEQHVPLRPITLIFGANSSGKSSLLHALLLARHAFVNGSWDVNHVELAGDSVDLGGFANYLHKKEQNTGKALTFSLDRTLGSDFALQGTLLAHANKVRVTLTISSGHSNAASLKSCQVDIDGERLFLLAPKNDGIMGIILWETEHPLSLRIVDWSCQRASVVSSKHEYEARVKEEMVAIHPLANLGEFSFLPTDAAFPSGITPTEAELNSLLLAEKITPEKRLSVAVRSLFPQILRDIFSDLHRLISSDLRELEYLGPLRSYPSRSLSDDEATDPNWRAGGGFAWKAVRQDQRVRDLVNDWLGQDLLKSRYRLEVRRIADEETIRRHLAASLAIHDELLMQGIVNRELSKGSLADEIELTSLDTRDYVSSNPDLHDRLAEYWYDAQQASLSDAEDEYTLEQARDDVLDTISGDLPLYRDEIREHYIENHPELYAIASALMDPAKSASDMTSKIVSQSKSQELVLLDLRSKTAVTHRDVGIGISQVLPVLVHAYASKNKLIAIEQPEIHLHPALQAELGDLFIESALGENGNHFILETHSEHLILRLLRRVRESTEGELENGKRGLRPADISVLYVEPTDQGSSVIELPVTADGDFSRPWPNGFFGERSTELF